MERPLGELRLCAIVIDGTPFKDRQIIVALGIGCDGRKTVLGLREGATENRFAFTDHTASGLDYLRLKLRQAAASRKTLRSEGGGRT